MLEYKPVRGVSMISVKDQNIERLKGGDFTNIAKFFESNRVFENCDADNISAIITGCGINKDTEVLYLIFLEVAKVLNTPVENMNLKELEHIHYCLSNEDTFSLDVYRNRDRDFYEKWFKFQVQEKSYDELIKQLFDVANDIYNQTKDFYISEIIDYMCTNENIKYREYALLKMENVERFLEDENEKIVKMAQEIIDVKRFYEELPLDGKLVVDLLEKALKVRIIKYYQKANSEIYDIYSSLFFEYSAIPEKFSLEIPNYYFKMPDLKMVACTLYEAIINRKLEFVEGKTPIFYTNLLSNNPRMI